jgi:hypothetical protein
MKYPTHKGMGLDSAKKLYSFHPLLAGAYTPTEYFLFHPYSLSLRPRELTSFTLGDFFVKR